MTIVEQVTEEMIDDVREQLKTVYEIVREEHTSRRMTFHITPLLSSYARTRMDTETAIIKKYCNSPFTMYSDTTNYRFTLVCN